MSAKWRKTLRSPMPARAATCGAVGWSTPSPTSAYSRVDERRAAALAPPCAPVHGVRDRDDAAHACGHGSPGVAARSHWLSSPAARCTPMSLTSALVAIATNALRDGYSTSATAS